MMCRFFGLVRMMLLTQVPLRVYGQVALGSADVKPFLCSVFECIANVDIKFRIFHETENNTGQLIAECDTAVLTCYLSNPSLAKYYSVKYTGKGGELVILEDNEQTRGNYSCCATYNSESCVRWKITGPIYTHKTTSHVSKTTEDTTLDRQSESKENAKSKQAILGQININEERKSDGADTYPILEAILVVLGIGITVIGIGITVIAVFQVARFCHKRNIERNIGTEHTDSVQEQQMTPLTQQDPARPIQV